MEAYFNAILLTINNQSMQIIVYVATYNSNYKFPIISYATIPESSQK